MGVHESMDRPLQEGLGSIDDDHQPIRWREPKHVHQEILGFLSVLPEVPKVTTEASHHGEEEHQDHQHLQQLRRCIKAVGCQTISEGEEGEELNIPLEEQLENDPPKAVGSKEDAHFMVEEAIEDFVEKEDHYEDEGDVECEVVHCAGNEHVVLPLFLHVGRIGLRVVEGNLLYWGL